MGVFLAPLLAACGIAGHIFLMRLPATADFVVPRHPGWGLFQGAMAWSRGGRWADLGALLLVLAACGWMLRDLWLSLDWGRRRARLLRPAVAAAGLAGALALLAAARLGAATWFDLLLNVWFVPEGADWREPLMAGLGVFWLVFLLSRSGRALAGWAASGDRACRGRLAWWGAGLLVPVLALYAWAAAVCDVRAGSAAEAAGILREPAEGESVLVLGRREGRPDVELRGGEGLSWAGLQALERHGSRRPLSVFRRQVERMLTEGYARRQDVPRLRQRLWAAQYGGDALGWLVLVEHLSCSPPDALTERLLRSLANERRWRIGPRAASLLSAAFAHHGLMEQAALWRGRAAAALGAAGGLLPAPEPGGALRPGSVRGVVRGLPYARAALYRTGGAWDPYVLSAANLAAAARADGRGRFAFSGLCAGDYFLTLSVPAGRLDPQRVAVRGHRGGISLSLRAPSAQVALDIQGGRLP